ncbi:MAG: DUF4147 domain-containing protein [Pseudomonadota bacterium]
MAKKERDLAADLFMAGVHAAAPNTITRQSVLNNIEQFHNRPVTVIATGKAALPMITGALEALANCDIVRAIAVTNRENIADLRGVDVFPAGHPVPDTEGLRAAEEIIECVSSLSQDDVLLFLVSGGTSAMLPAPAGDLTLADEIAATEMLLASGAPIDVVNAIRSRLSKVKGGGLSRLAGQASINTLMLSDVPGDDPAVIGSGPTIASHTSDDDMAAMLNAYGLDRRFNEAVLAELHKPSVSFEVDLGPRFSAVIGSNKISLDAVVSAATKRSLHVEVVSEWLDGDVDEASRRFALAAGACKQRPAVLIAGGETTVQLVGDGKGGRNQELALRFIMHAKDVQGPWVFLSGGTDGRDGPTDAAGGLIDHMTLSRIGVEGLKAALGNNDAYHALQQSGDLLMTGATGTNVADLQILLLQ